MQRKMRRGQTFLLRKGSGMGGVASHAETEEQREVAMLKWNDADWRKMSATLTKTRLQMKMKMPKRMRDEIWVMP